jgi:hypothetical protein
MKYIPGNMYMITSKSFYPQWSDSRFVPENKLVLCICSEAKPQLIDNSINSALVDWEKYFVCLYDSELVHVFKPYALPV